MKQMQQENYKKAIVDYSAEDIVLSSLFTGIKEII